MDKVLESKNTLDQTVKENKQKELKIILSYAVAHNKKHAEEIENLLKDIKENFHGENCKEGIKALGEALENFNRVNEKLSEAYENFKGEA